MSLVGPRPPAPPAQTLPRPPLSLSLLVPAAFQATRFYVSARSPLARELCVGPACNEVERAQAQGPGESAGPLSPPTPYRLLPDHSAGSGKPVPLKSDKGLLQAQEGSIDQPGVRAAVLACATPRQGAGWAGLSGVGGA
jgi:hypothetical protein